jgi:hypothetical protein
MPYDHGQGQLQWLAARGRLARQVEIGRIFWPRRAERPGCFSTVGPLASDRQFRYILATPPWPWARSSAGEHYVDIVGVTGSIPVAPTSFFNSIERNSRKSPWPRYPQGIPRPELAAECAHCRIAVQTFRAGRDAGADYRSGGVRGSRIHRSTFTAGHRL